MLRDVWLRLSGGFRSYASHPDPLVSSANFIALLVASNQPFYPLYLYWAATDKIGPAWFTFLSTPFFLAVPAVARRSPLAGRALLPLAGIGNTILCAQLFGVRSAVEVFLIPCAVLALLLFRPAERIAGFALAGLAIAAFVILHGRYGQPYIAYSAAEYGAMIRLNALSAGMLTLCAALIFSNLLSQAERSVSEARSGQEPR